MNSDRIDAGGYCRDCRTKHGPWGHVDFTLETVSVDMHRYDGGMETDLYRDDPSDKAVQ